ncbi:Mor transcription activator family protein [Craterilacuibacter sinensis]|uniref:Mor transcription activator domain-containing protein n=1 Tax=Craterilacuibacter sinensis TaxID=2686017 RepID=A0A845BN56_9NEIS|nr:Mor transcription activator family protein [Craterilacuibacter sinensis]MXR36694.1 hypothetical protein [Craterilacuibacter sinensis]
MDRTYPHTSTSAAIVEDDFDRHDMPASAIELALHLGRFNAASIINALGGCSIKVPVINSEIYSGYLKDAIDDAALERMMKAYGGSILYIPTCKKTTRWKRDTCIRIKFDELTKKISGNNAVFILSIEFKISDREIWRIIKKL